MTIKQNHNLIQDFEKDQPCVLYLDTETTGLNIMKDKPFLITIGWNDKIYITSPNDANVQYIFDHSSVRTIWVWNAKYDAHMLYNIGFRIPWNKWNDGIAVAMLAGYVDQPYSKVGLKDLAENMLGLHDPVVDTIDKKYRKLMSDFKRKSFTQKNYTYSKLVTLMKTIDYEWADLPTIVQQEWTTYQTAQHPTYADIDETTMLTYAKNDVYIMRKLLLTLFPIVQKRQQIETLKFEQSTLEPFWAQERQGIKINRDYLMTVRENIKRAVKNGREQLYQLLGEKINVNQHQKLKEKFSQLYALDTKSVDINSLLKIKQETTNTNLKTSIHYILKLRSLEKWYSTYCLRILENIDQNQILRTSFNLFGSKTGRITSNFHQFPNNILKDFNGAELFNVRKMVIPFGNQFSKLAFYDYSEMELRIQAEFTHQLKNPDRILTAAYLGDHLIDLHTQTAEIFFGKEFGLQYRKIGKQIMFAFIYGASPNGIYYNLKNWAIPQMPSYSAIKNLYHELNQKYSGITTYQKKVLAQIVSYKYATNLWGRRYYFWKNHEALYKAYNFLIQGSGAYMMKAKVVELYRWLKSQNKKSFIFLTIHDEIVIAIHQDEETDYEAIGNILESFPQFKIPMKINLATTSTNWAEKQKKAP